MNFLTFILLYLPAAFFVSFFIMAPRFANRFSFGVIMWSFSTIMVALMLLMVFAAVYRADHNIKENDAIGLAAALIIISPLVFFVFMHTGKGNGDRDLDYQKTKHMKIGDKIPVVLTVVRPANQ